MQTYDFCEINKSGGSNKTELFFYGDIVSSSWDQCQWEDQYPDNIRYLLRDIGDGDLDIHINSAGGNVFAGFTIHNMLKNLKGSKTVYVDGLAASIASVIAMAGDQIIMPSNSFIMIHKPMVSLMIGNADELRAEAEVLDKLEQGILSTYMNNTLPDVTEKAVSKMIASETWLSASEAAEVFKNIVIEQPNEAVAKLDVSSYKNYRNVPDKLLKIDKQDEPDMSSFIEFEKLLNIKYTSEEN